MRYNPWWDAQARYPWIHIEWVDLAPARAAWCSEQQVILIDESISDVERRCALAHELAHIDTGDAQADGCWFAGRQETDADELAALRLVTVDEIEQALYWCSDPRELAQAVGVTCNVLRLRARLLHQDERKRLNYVLTRRDTAA